MEASGRQSKISWTPLDHPTQVAMESESDELNKPMSPASPPRIEEVPITPEVVQTEKRVTTPTHGLNALSEIGAPTTNKPVKNSIQRVTAEGWTVEEVVANGPKTFRPIERISVAELSHEDIVKMVEDVTKSGIPTIFSDWHLRPGWDGGLLSVNYLLENIGDTDLQTRDIHTRTDNTSTLAEYIEYTRSITSYSTRDEQSRFYGKDAPVPPGWGDWLHSMLPEKLLSHGSGDEMSKLAPHERPETLMCYYGVGDTYTPAHKDLCASVGHNIMTVSENRGSSLWFMTSTEDSDAASRFFLKKRQELDFETHFASLEQWTGATFPVYVCDQVVGDLVIVPMRSCHQVINKGGLTVKTSWSRMTLQSLRLSLIAELPIYRRVGRPEIYRVKRTAWKATRAFTKDLQGIIERGDPITVAINQLDSCLELIDGLIEEHYSPKHAEYKKFIGHNATEEDWANNEQNLGCGYCGSDLFLAAFTCNTCGLPNNRIDDNAMDIDNTNPTTQRQCLICPGCYLEGRSCPCEVMVPCTIGNIETILQDRNMAIEALSVAADKSDERMGRWLKMSEADRSTTPKFPPTFLAATYLGQLRALKPVRPIKSCNMWRGRNSTNSTTHPGPHYMVFTCKDCHSAGCWTHLLEKHGMHSIELILLSRGEATTAENWHARHHQTAAQRAKPEFEDLNPSRWESLEWQTWIAMIASRYPNSHPVVEGFWRPGWYDRTWDWTPYQLPARGSKSPQKKPRKSRAEPTEPKPPPPPPPPPTPTKVVKEKPPPKPKKARVLPQPVVVEKPTPTPKPKPKPKPAKPSVKEVQKTKPAPIAEPAPVEKTRKRRRSSIAEPKEMQPSPLKKQKRSKPTIPPPTKDSEDEVLGEVAPTPTRRPSMPHVERSTKSTRARAAPQAASKILPAKRSPPKPRTTAHAVFKALKSKATQEVQDVGGRNSNFMRPSGVFNTPPLLDNDPPSPPPRVTEPIVERPQPSANRSYFIPVNTPRASLLPPTRKGPGSSIPTPSPLNQRPSRLSNGFSTGARPQSRNFSFADLDNEPDEPVGSHIGGSFTPPKESANEWAIERQVLRRRESLLNDREQIALDREMKLAEREVALLAREKLILARELKVRQQEDHQQDMQNSPSFSMT